MLRFGNRWYENVPDSGSEPSDVNSGGKGLDNSIPSRRLINIRE